MHNDRRAFRGAEFHFCPLSCQVVQGLLLTPLTMHQTTCIRFTNTGKSQASCVARRTDASLKRARPGFTQKIVPWSLRGLAYLVDVVAAFWLAEATTGRNRLAPYLVKAEGTLLCLVTSANQKRERNRGSQWFDGRAWQARVCPPPVTMWKPFFSLSSH